MVCPQRELDVGFLHGNRCRLASAELGVGVSTRGNPQRSDGDLLHAAIVAAATAGAHGQSEHHAHKDAHQHDADAD